MQILTLEVQNCFKRESRALELILVLLCILTYILFRKISYLKITRHHFCIITCSLDQSTEVYFLLCFELYRQLDMFDESQTLSFECDESDFDLNALRMKQLNIIDMRLRTDYSTFEKKEIRTSSIVSVAVKKSMNKRGPNTKFLLPQYELLAERIDLFKRDFALSSKTSKKQKALNPRLFLNVNAS